jgi:hypothetical protein
MNDAVNSLFTRCSCHTEKSLKLRNSVGSAGTSTVQCKEISRDSLQISLLAGQSVVRAPHDGLGTPPKIKKNRYKSTSKKRCYGSTRQTTHTGSSVDWLTGFSLAERFCDTGFLTSSRSNPRCNAKSPSHATVA